ncbi:MAG: hypothetical protein U0359_10355 [Byssovorax sp.]
MHATMPLDVLPDAPLDVPLALLLPPAPAVTPFPPQLRVISEANAAANMT